MESTRQTMGITEKTGVDRMGSRTINSTREIPDELVLPVVLIMAHIRNNKIYLFN